MQLPSGRISSRTVRREKSVAWLPARVSSVDGRSFEHVPHWCAGRLLAESLLVFVRRNTPAGRGTWCTRSLTPINREQMRRIRLIAEAETPQKSICLIKISRAIATGYPMATAEWLTNPRGSNFLTLLSRLSVSHLIVFFYVSLEFA